MTWLASVGAFLKKWGLLFVGVVVAFLTFKWVRAEHRATLRDRDAKDANARAAAAAHAAGVLRELEKEERKRRTELEAFRETVHAEREVAEKAHTEAEKKLETEVQATGSASDEVNRRINGGRL
jgi:ABC-type nickel/cobalt efflux system permease component RcnA